MQHVTSFHVLSLRRLLCWKLTDGKTSCKALEFRPVAGAEGSAVAPGAKVVLAGAIAKLGIILVDGKSLKVPDLACSSFQDIFTGMCHIFNAVRPVYRVKRGTEHAYTSVTRACFADAGRSSGGAVRGLGLPA